MDRELRELPDGRLCVPICPRGWVDAKVLQDFPGSAEMAKVSWAWAEGGAEEHDSAIGVDPLSAARKRSSRKDEDEAEVCIVCFDGDPDATISPVRHAITMSILTARPSHCTGSVVRSPTETGRQFLERRAKQDSLTAQALLSVRKPPQRPEDDFLEWAKQNPLIAQNPWFATAEMAKMDSWGRCHPEPTDRCSDSDLAMSLASRGESYWPHHKSSTPSSSCAVKL
eukprot:s5616_g4.t1